MIKFIVGFSVALLLIIGAGAYFIGFGQGPRDLGIKYSVADSEAARNKVGTEVVAIRQGDNKNDFTLEGKKIAEFTMDSKELSANSGNRSWKNYPLKNVQIKISDDGTIEGSATLVIAKGLPYAMALGYSEEQIKNAMTKYNLPQFEVPFYVRGKGEVINDKVTVDAQTIEIGKVSIPASIVSQVNSEAKKVLEDIIHKHSSSFHAESVTFANGKMNFKGTVADKEYVIVNN